MQAHLREKRPFIFDLPVHQVPFELLFQITLCGGAVDDSRKFYGQVVSEIESVIDSYLHNKTATVADTLIATSRIYTLFQNISLDSQAQESQEIEDEKGVQLREKFGRASPKSNSERQRQQRRRTRAICQRGNICRGRGDRTTCKARKTWTHNEIPEQL